MLRDLLAFLRRLLPFPERFRERAEEGVDREIAFHLAERERRLIAEGMRPDAARAEALRRFGDLARARRAIGATAARNENRLEARDWARGLLDDLRYVMRSLARARALVTVAILTFALGIGANAAMFGIIDRLLLSGPAHIEQPSDLYRVYATVVPPQLGPRTVASFGYVSYALLRDQATTLGGVATYAQPYDQVIGRGDEARMVPIARASWDFFPLLGVRPALGRFYDEAEDAPPDGQRVLVIGHDLWRSAFDGDSGIIGRSVDVNGEAYTIVGVAPRGFTGVELHPVDAWEPMSLTQPVTDWPTAWNGQWLYVVARLRSGATVEAASAEATTIHRRNYNGRSEVRAKASLDLRPTRLDLGGREPPETAVARWLVGVAVIVLLIACANVGNLLLARGLARRRELAVRTALGIGTARLVRLLLLEGVVLALAGGIAGLALAWWAGALMRTILLPDVSWVGGPVDLRVLGVAAAVTVTCGIVVGLVPALVLARRDLSGSLKAGSQQSGVPRSRMRAGLLVAQCGLSVVLLVGAGLFVRSLGSARAVEFGFEPGRVVRAQIIWPRGEGGEAEQRRRRQVYLSALDRLRESPDVRRAAIAVGTPFGFAFGVDLRVPGLDSIPQLPGGGPYISVVTPDYFETLGAQLLEGRAFDATDREGSERVAIVNAPMAAALWPGERAIGKCLQVFNEEVPCARVVGVVAELRRDALREPPAMQYYVPFGHEVGIGGSALMIRPTASIEAFLPTLQRVLREVDPSMLSLRVEPMRDVVDALSRQWQLGAALFGLFGALALVMAAIGLYSVIGYLVEQRRPEFGVRMALGSSRGGIVRLVLRSGVPVALGGLGLGFLVAFAAGPAIAPLLFELSPRDPITFATVAVVLGGVVLVASIVPAARASRVDPAAALRSD